MYPTVETMVRISINQFNFYSRALKTLKIHLNTKINKYWYGKRNMQQNGLALRHASRN